jgi:hypothetical protein
MRTIAHDLAIFVKRDARSAFALDAREPAAADAPLGRGGDAASPAPASAVARRIRGSTCFDSTSATSKWWLGGSVVEDSKIERPLSSVVAVVTGGGWRRTRGREGDGGGVRGQEKVLKE